MIEKVHFNRPQLKVLTVGARRTMCAWGRGTGKSEGVLAPKQMQNMLTMPRCSGATVGPNYGKMLEQLLPKVVSGWRRFGYERDVHYWIGVPPPKKLNVPRPYNAPIRCDHYITWFTGAGMHIISQDRKVTSNGLDVDFIHGDEAKLLDPLKLKSELFPTNRGNRIHFGHLPQHHELLFLTDKFGGNKWWMSFKDEHDEELVQTILAIQSEIKRLKRDGTQPRRLERLRKDLVELQKVCTFYSEADIFDNIDAVGIEFIEDQARNLTPIEFRSALGNEDDDKVEGGFYALLDSNIHGYDTTNYSFLDSLGYDFERIHDTQDCRRDFINGNEGDLNPHAPLNFGFDWGGNFNGANVAQRHGREFRNVKSFFAYPPDSYITIAHQMVEYYRFMSHKHARFSWDKSGDHKRAHTNKTMIEEVAEIFAAAGWTYEFITKGARNPGHDAKYKMWLHVLDESPARDNRYPLYRYHKTNAHATYVSMARCEVKMGRAGTGKEKKEETKKNIMQELAPHLSDSMDYIMWDEFGNIEAGEMEFGIA